MNKVQLSELHNLALNAKGEIRHIYLHWSAGSYNNPSEDYHVNITGDGDILVDTDDFTEVKAHTWRRNTAAIGISMLCCASASCSCEGHIHWGDYPPTKVQIETMAKAVATICAALELPITSDNVMTHCEAAELDEYGPSTTCERWDLWFLEDTDGTIRPGGELIRGKAIWYQQHS